MTLADLLPDIRSLPKCDKLRLIQMLAAEVATEEETAIGSQSKPIAVWSPFDSTAGAAVLLDMLSTDNSGTP